QYGKYIRVWLQCKDTSELAHSERQRDGRVPGMRADINRDIARTQKLAQFIHGLLRDLFFRFAGMQPLGVLDGTFLWQIKLSELVPIRLRSGPDAEKVW